MPSPSARVSGTELLAGRKTEDFVQWVKNEMPAAFLIGTDGGTVTSAYGEVMLWVQRNPQYLDQAKAKFATEADGWLVAYAMAKNVVIITNEQPRPQSRNRILLLDVCNRSTSNTRIRSACSRIWPSGSSGQASCLPVDRP
jgi:hypothetical protein